jgi:recombinational DNA repair protein (RecF pathway)
MTFAEGVLDVHFKENRDLQTFREFSPTRVRKGLARNPLRLAGASVLGEVILKHAESEGNPEVFHRLRQGLDEVEGREEICLLPSLLASLWSLIRALGFGPVIQVCVECGRDLSDEEVARFDFGAGGMVCKACHEGVAGPRLGPVARVQLQALVDGNPLDDLLKPATHLRLVSDFITYHLSGGTPLRSMAFLSTLVPDNDA